MQRSLVRRSARLALTLAALLALAFAGCKGSVEGQTARYNRVKDSLSAFATKHPAMKADIQTKLAEFEAEFQAASQKGGDEAISAIAAVCARMEAYEREINPEKKAAAAQGTTAPAAAQPAPTPAAGGKLDQPPAGQVAPTPAAGGKLDQPPAGQVAPPPAAGGKLGGGAAPAAPQGGSGFGGAAPAAPAAPQGGSGFGGQ